MRSHHDEIIIYSNPASSATRKVQAFAKGHAPYVRIVSNQQTKLTHKQWRDILDALAPLRPKDLMNRAHDYYQSNIRGRDFNKEGWIKILINNPDMLGGPIAIRGKNAVYCDNPGNVMKLIRVNKAN